MSFSVVVLMGPPGVGKGTQASLLADRHGVIHISTGGLLRSESASKSELGIEIEAIMGRGDLVSDAHLFRCLERALGGLSSVCPDMPEDKEAATAVYAKRVHKGASDEVNRVISGQTLSTAPSNRLVLLDGVPRNLAQVSMLDEALALVGAKVNLALALEAPVEKLVSRFEKRWGCTNCGGVFALEAPPSGGATCSRCGMAGTLVRRADDAPEAVRYRFGVFESATAPVVSAYLERGLLERLDGLAEREEVYAELVAKIIKIFPLAGC